MVNPKKPATVSGKEERTQAETKAMAYVKQKHSKVDYIFLRTVYREGIFWILHGEVTFKRARFFAAERSFKIQINNEDYTIKSYEETP